MSIAAAISVLNSLVSEGIIEKYAIGGAVGATFYLEPVATVDIDVFVQMPAKEGSQIVDPGPVFVFLQSKGHSMEGEYVRIGDWPVQFLAPPGPLGDEAINESRSAIVEGMQVQVFSAEHLAALALASGRAKDRSRLLEFIEEGALDAERFEAIVERHQLRSAWRQFKKESLSEP